MGDDAVDSILRGHRKSHLVLDRRAPSIYAIRSPCSLYTIPQGNKPPSGEQAGSSHAMTPVQQTQPLVPPGQFACYMGCAGSATSEGVLFQSEEEVQSKWRWRNESQTTYHIDTCIHKPARQKLKLLTGCGKSVGLVNTGCIILRGLLTLLHFDDSV